GRFVPLDLLSRSRSRSRRRRQCIVIVVEREAERREKEREGERERRPLGDRSYLGDVGEGVVELVVGRLEDRCFRRHRELEVGLGAIASHILGATRLIPTAAILNASRAHRSEARYFRRTHVRPHLKFERKPRHHEFLLDPD
ncbi:hypothetical protein ALC60_05735, partial [Trachymyrmex zeteki]